MVVADRDDVTVDREASELSTKLWRSTIVVGGVLLMLRPPFRLAVAYFPPLFPTHLVLSHVTRAVKLVRVL